MLVVFKLVYVDVCWFFLGWVYVDVCWLFLGWFMLTYVGCFYTGFC